MTRPFVPARIVFGSVIAEVAPFAYEAVARYRGVEVFDEPLPARRVIVCEPHAHIEGEAHFLDVFQASVVQRLALAGTAVPEVLYVLGREGRPHALVEEEVSGIALDEVLAELRQQGHELPLEVALAIAAALVGLWRVPIERGSLIPLHVGPSEIVVTPTGDIRATPQLANERARQVVGAMVNVVEPHIAYLSPEQVEGRFGEQSGMFTFGLILYELLATRHPIAKAGSSSMMEILSQLRYADVPSILEHRLVPPQLVAFLARATARDPHARFESWDDLSVALDAVHAELPLCGRTEILDALPVRPVAPPELAPHELAGWRTLPHDGMTPIVVQPGPTTRPDAPVRASLALDHVYRGDGRPMLAHGELLVDVRPVSVAELARFTLATRRASFEPPRDDAAVATNVSFEDAVAYAAWAGKRLPSESEWVAAVEALGADRLGTGIVWEWTTTLEHGGRVVRGGRWRDAPGRAPAPANRSFETQPARDVGFRCVADEDR